MAVVFAVAVWRRKRVFTRAIVGKRSIEDALGDIRLGIVAAEVGRTRVVCRIVTFAVVRSAVLVVVDAVTAQVKGHRVRYVQRQDYINRGRF